MARHPLDRAQRICAKAVRDLRTIEAGLDADTPSTVKLRLMSTLLDRYARECASPSVPLGDLSAAFRHTEGGRA